IQRKIRDDQAEPSKAATNAKRLLTQDNISLLILSSLSSTYAPVIAESKRANVPLMFMGAVCPKEVYPPAEALQFCTTAYAGGYDSRATLAFIKETAKEPVRLGAHWSRIRAGAPEGYEALRDRGEFAVQGCAPRPQGDRGRSW